MRRFVYEVPLVGGELATFDIPEVLTESDAERMCNMIAAVVMGVPPTGGEQYFADRMTVKEYAEAYRRARDVMAAESELEEKR